MMSLNSKKQTFRFDIQCTIKTQQQNLLETFIYIFYTCLNNSANVPV